MDLDIHGKTWPEVRTEFREIYNAAVRAAHGGKTINIIHGYGSTGTGGVLQARFRKYLKKHESRLTFKPGEELDGNPGRTAVEAISPLPDDDEILEDLILDYCRQPRTRDKIAGRFRRYGDPKIRQAVQSLLAAPPLLNKIVKSGRDMYQTL